MERDFPPQQIKEYTTESLIKFQLREFGAKTREIGNINRQAGVMLEKKKITEEKMINHYNQAMQLGGSAPWTMRVSRCICSSLNTRGEVKDY